MTSADTQYLLRQIQDLRHMVGELQKRTRRLEKWQQPISKGWKPIETAPKDRSIILGGTASHAVTYIGRYRYGNLGEPQQSVLAWRCDSSGRFSHPTHWMEAPGKPGRQS